MGSWGPPEAIHHAKQLGQYDDSLAYVVEGDGDPLSLVGTFVFAGTDRYLFEVDPEGELHRGVRSPIWAERACKSAIVKRCVYEPTSDITAPPNS